MRLEQLRLFLLVSEYGSISAASRIAAIAQPAVSVQMKQLENSVGTQLFERTVKGIKLTSAGQVLKSHADAILRHVEQAAQEVRHSSADPSGLVVVALSKSLVPPLAGRLFWLCHERYPKIDLRLLDLSVKDSHQLVQTREVDFGLLPNAPALDNVSIYPLIAQDLYLVGPKVTDQAKGASVEFKDLHQYPLVMGDANDQLRYEMERLAIKHGYALNIKFVQDSAAIYHEIVRSGDIYTVVPYSIFAHDIEAGVLSVHRIVNPTPERTMSIVFRKSIKPSNAALAVKSLVVELVKNLFLTSELRGHLLSTFEE